MTTPSDVPLNGERERGLRGGDDSLGPVVVIVAARESPWRLAAAFFVIRNGLAYGAVPQRKTRADPQACSTHGNRFDRKLARSGVRVISVLPVDEDAVALATPRGRVLRIRRGIALGVEPASTFATGGGVASSSTR